MDQRAVSDSQQADRKTILWGLAWLDAEAQRRFEAPSPRSTQAQKAAICDDICYLPEAKPQFADGRDILRESTAT